MHAHINTPHTRALCGEQARFAVLEHDAELRRHPDEFGGIKKQIRLWLWHAHVIERYDLVEEVV